MTRHHQRLVLRQLIEHRNGANLRLHTWTYAVSWLALCTVLSQVALPLAAPPALANLGAAFVVLSLLYWVSVDALVTLLVGALTAAWALLPCSPWGPGHGWLQGVVAPLALSLGMVVTAHYGHVYHHEHGAFMRGDPRWRVALQWVQTQLWGVFQYGLLSLLRAGWRPALREALARAERVALRTREQVPWTNWAGIASGHARHVSTPQTVDDLREAIVEAHARGQRVRVVASGFSWSSVALADETLIFCERLDKVTVDPSDPTLVWVEAGVTNRQLNAELSRLDLCMPWNVVLENVRLAGIVSTGTHGCGKDTSTVSDLVEAFEVLDIEGKLHVVSEATVGREVMDAARMGLGLFGVIARIQLRVAKLHRVRQSDVRLPAREVLGRLSELVATHDSVELYWFPFNDDMWMRTIDRTDAPRTFHGHGFWFKTQNFVQNAWLTLFSKLIMAGAPSLTPLLLKLGMYMLPFRTRVLDLPESHHYHHWIEMMRCGCLEVGFKVDQDCANARRAWETAQHLVEAYAKRGLYPLNLTLNMRFVGASKAMLSPAYGEGITCYIEIMWVGRPRAWDAFSSELCRAWLEEPGALPHWSKEFEHVEDVVSIMRHNLGDRRERFLAALASTGVDPERRFFNALVRRVLVDDPSVTGARHATGKQEAA